MRVQFNDMFRSHIERCLQKAWDINDVEADSHSDYPYRFNTAMCWVSPEADEPVGLRVFAYAAVDVPKSAKMLAEVNQLNASARWTSVFFDHGLVIVERTLLASSVDPESVSHATFVVGRTADEIGTLICSVYGGTTPLPPETVTVDDDRARMAAPSPCAPHPVNRRWLEGTAGGTALISTEQDSERLRSQHWSTLTSSESVGRQWSVIAFRAPAIAGAFGLVP